MNKEELISKTLESLKRNGFNVYFAQDCNSAENIFFREILPNCSPQAISWADSITLASTNIVARLSQDESFEKIITFGAGMSWEEKIENRRKALLCDLFITGSNAITSKGQIVNLDMIGNRINGINFGPKNVALFVGVNKIVNNLDAAMTRIKKISAPLNAKRHTHFHTPCQKTGVCIDCSSEQRICNEWSIIEKCFPKGRINVVLINQELGF